MKPDEFVYLFIFTCCTFAAVHGSFYFLQYWMLQRPHLWTSTLEPNEYLELFYQKVPIEDASQEFFYFFLDLFLTRLSALSMEDYHIYVQTSPEILDIVGWILNHCIDRMPDKGCTWNGPFTKEPFQLPPELPIELGPDEIPSIIFTTNDYHLLLDFLGDFFSIALFGLFLFWICKRYLTQKNIIRFLIRL